VISRSVHVCDHFVRRETQVFVFIGEYCPGNSCPSFKRRGVPLTNKASKSALEKYFFFQKSSLGQKLRRAIPAFFGRGQQSAIVASRQSRPIHAFRTSSIYSSQWVSASKAGHFVSIHLARIVEGKHFRSFQSHNRIQRSI